MEEIKEIIRRHITLHIMKKTDHSILAFQDKLIEDGIVDSVGIVDLVGFLEQEFDITISRYDMVFKNFETIEAIAELVGSLRKASNNNP